MLVPALCESGSIELCVQHWWILVLATVWTCLLSFFWEDQNQVLFLSKIRCTIDPLQLFLSTKLNCNLVCLKLTLAIYLVIIFITKFPVSKVGIFSLRTIALICPLSVQVKFWHCIGKWNSDSSRHWQLAKNTTLWRNDWPGMWLDNSAKKMQTM